MCVTFVNDTRGLMAKDLQEMVRYVRGKQLTAYHGLFDDEVSDAAVDKVVHIRTADACRPMRSDGSRYSSKAETYLSS